MSQDMRTRLTRKVIKESLFSLLHEKALNKVTVKEICELSEINRSTFYRYYDDPFDLMAQVEEEYVAAFKKYAMHSSSKSISDNIEEMAAAVKKNRETFLVLVSQSGRNDFISKIVEESYQYYHDGFVRRYPDLSEQQRKWLYIYLAQGCVSVILDWMNGGCVESPHEIAMFITGIYTRLF